MAWIDLGGCERRGCAFGKLFGLELGMAQTLQQFPGTDDFYAFVGMREMLLVASYM